MNIKTQLEQFSYKTVGFTGVITLLSSITASLIGLFFSEGTSLLIIGKTMAVLVLYALIGLIAEDLRGLDELMLRIYNTIGIDPTLMTFEQKMTLIRSNIEIAVKQWNKYWKLYQEVVNGALPLEKRIERMKEFLLDIPKGQLNIAQVAYICVYYAYTILFYSGIVSIDPYVDAIIFIIILALLLLSSGSPIGIAQFFKKIFETIKTYDANDLQYKLEIISQFIIDGVHKYFYLDITKLQG